MLQSMEKWVIYFIGDLWRASEGGFSLDKYVGYLQVKQTKGIQKRKIKLLLGFNTWAFSIQVQMHSRWIDNHQAPAECQTLCKVSTEDENTEKTQDMISVHKELIGFLENNHWGKQGPVRAGVCAWAGRR